MALHCQYRQGLRSFFSVVSSLWIGRKLNELSKICIKSWIKQGYAVDLYVNELTEKDFSDDLLPYINLIDYKEIECNYENDEILPYSDYWRYNLLKQKPQSTWIDADMFLLDRLPTTNIIISSEHTMQSGAYKSKKTYNPNIGVLKLNNMEGQMFLSEVIEKIDKSKKATFCDNMKKFRDILKKDCYGEIYRYIYKPNAFCSVPWWDCCEIYKDVEEYSKKYNVAVKSKDYILNNSIGLHTWNNFTYNKYKIDFYKLPENCLYNTLKNWYD